METLLGDRTSGRLFMTKIGSPLKVGEVGRYVLGPICKKLGIPHGGMHAFRHGRVSLMQDAGVNEKVIQTEIGQSSLRMTPVTPLTLTALSFSASILLLIGEARNRKIFHGASDPICL